MLQPYSIKDLYMLALAEGEGMGTAYEYYAKRILLGQWLTNQNRPQSILIAGLPEKYGVSLDFFLLAAELGAKVTVIDERYSALARLNQTLAELKHVQAAPLIDLPSISTIVDGLIPTSVTGHFDLVLSSEAIQRLDVGARAFYVEHLAGLAENLALFAPNSNNEAHTTISGLTGIGLQAVRNLAEEAIEPSGGQKRQFMGYIDMPPFPPGITRSETQREQATKGRLESIAMWGLGRYAYIEKFVPAAIRQRRSHIVYLLHSN